MVRMRSTSGHESSSVNHSLSLCEAEKQDTRVLTSGSVRMSLGELPSGRTRAVMRLRSSIGAMSLAALLASATAAGAFEDAQYPDLGGLWRSINARGNGQIAFDPTKP